jgi:hypothetical protein
VGCVSKTLLALLSYNVYSGTLSNPFSPLCLFAGIVVDIGHYETTVEIYHNSEVLASATFPGMN